LGGAVAEALMEQGVLPGFFHRMGLRNIFSTVVGSQNYLRRAYSLDAQAIVEVATAKLNSSAQVCPQ